MSVEEVTAILREIMGIFSGKSSESHGNDPNKPWEVSEKEAKEIKERNDRAATRLAKESKGAR